MKIKENYCSPKTDALELRYAEQLCITLSGGDEATQNPDFILDEYDPLWNI